MVWSHAGSRLLGTEKVVSLIGTIPRYCGLSAPLTVELFCGGVLGALLRVAQRVVAAQANATQEEKIAEHLLCVGLAAAVEAVGSAVPQARASAASASRPSSATSSAWRSVRVPLNAQVASIHEMMEREVSARPYSTPTSSLPHLKSA